ncbi:MBL fold metallo-hydrolase [Sphingosinicella terrae]|uniref:MBL fold metallo-hydrolase n=1 Tax=Sphingosinicella terrae TaxID=2172047 RepID=UPI000E0DD161|nr:MBL fold metallo-hydrolase [Sphingosinicella terrae]
MRSSMLRAACLLGFSALALPAAAEPDPSPAGWHVVPGSFEPGRGPDGNSVFLDAPGGLILVDTGRHPAHRDRLLGYARTRGRPIAAIVNTHWHLDHSTGNGEIRAAFPEAPLYATSAVEGALAGFLRDGRARAETMLTAGDVPPEREAEVRRFLAVMDAPDALRPTRPVVRSGEVEVAGRRLQLNVAPFAATEADLWIFDPDSGLLVAGDLVVAEVPFMDTACPEGWREALATVAATPFTTLVPGHGEPMDRAAFAAWRSAFDNLLDCAASDRAKDACVAGWRRDAARFIAPGREAMIDEMTGYYLETRLRAAPEERQRHCRHSAS